MVRRFCAILLGTLAILLASVPTTSLASENGEKVYGEWRILVKSDKTPEYDRLIEADGLPLFREAGGRMVGWWKTLIGNLYEHLTIWEYDNMAAFEKAVAFLGHDKRFGAFVARRDPLLSGEENRFLKLSEMGLAPELHDPAKFVIHEVHRVPFKTLGAHLDYFDTEGLKLLKSHGFRPAGPLTTTVGRWTEVTLLFRFDSLAERERLVATFNASDEGKRYAARVGELASDITNRLLLPAAFATPSMGSGRKAAEAGASETSPLLPHLERVASRTFAAGFSDKYRSANCGFVGAATGSTLIDLPRGTAAAEFVKEVERLTGSKPKRLLLTHADKSDLPVVAALVSAGVSEIVVTPAGKRALLGEGAAETKLPVRVCAAETQFGERGSPVRFVPCDGTAAANCAYVVLPSEGLLLGGPVVVHGPRVQLIGADTQAWLALLEELETKKFIKVIPGFGSWGGGERVIRQRRYLGELRSQVGYAIALGRPPEYVEKQVRISPEFQVWMPYDNPGTEDLLYVFRELTVPIAPYNGREPKRGVETAPHALVLIGDGPHEPQHLEEGLRPAFAAAGIVPHFTVDVRALSSENLARVELLVILRDGRMRPTDDEATHYCWVTKEYERTVTEFVEKGGGFLNLHNSLGLYPDEGPYLKLAAGRYIGHGPLERFRVVPVHGEHPITHGLGPFSVADEQHTPVVDLPRVKLLLRSYSDAGEEGMAGWVCEPGAGRLCHLANGHTRDALAHPTYQTLLRNAMLWCVRRELAVK